MPPITTMLRHAHAFVAVGAGGPGDVAGKDRRLGVEVRLDGVDAVAIGADGRLEVAARHRLPMDALRVLLPDAVVALGAGGRDVELIDARFGIAGRPDLVAAVAVSADRGLGGTGGHRFAVDALLVVDESS